MPLVELSCGNAWYDERGHGPPLVLLHPGGIDSRAFGDSVGVFAEHFRVLLPDRRGFGRTPDVEGPFTFEALAEDTVEFLERVIEGPARLLGISDGAMVAVGAATRRPDLVEQLVCISGPCHKDGWLPEAIDPANEPPEFFATAYGEVSPDGPEHFGVVMAKLAEAHLVGPTLGPDDLAKITSRALVMLADDDEVTLEHAVAFYRALPRGELAVVPGTSHGLVVERAELVHRLVLEFLTQPPVQPMVPVRRAPAP